ncbi:MAG: hypothetical protein IIA45_04940 [Bacteroidetes bacterium]|nr:hypothetical protein [Bacteroidota bacterium]
MVKKLLFSLLGLAIVIGFLFYFWIYPKVLTATDPYEAVPLTSSIILECRNLENALSELSTTSYSEMLDSIPFVKLIASKNKMVLNLLERDESIIEMYERNGLLIAVHINTSSSIDLLYIMSMSGGMGFFGGSSPDLMGIIEEQGGDVEERTFEGQNIWATNLEGQKFYLTFVNKLLIGSFSEILVEDAIKQLGNAHNLINDTNFKKARELSGKDIDISVYVNMKSLPFLLSTFVSSEAKGRASILKNFANWVAVDVLIKNDKLLFSGYTMYNDSSNKFLSLMNSQTPQPIGMVRVIPGNTAMLMWFGLSDYNLFINMLNEPHGARNKFTDEYISGWVGNELGLVYLENVDGNYLDMNAAVIQVKNISSAQNSLREISDSSSIQQYGKYEINRITKKHLRMSSIKFDVEHTLFHGFFPGVFDHIDQPYYVIIGDYVIFSNNSVVIKKMISQYAFQQQLGMRLDYQKFSENLSEKSSIFIYVNTSNAKEILRESLNQGALEEFNNHISNITYLNHVAFQFSSFKQKYYTTICAQIGDEIVAETHLVKSFEIRERVIIPPQAVINHNTNEKEIILQDINNDLILLNNEGGLLWAVGLGEKILSDIYQIDFYKNGKLQYLFNTLSNIFLIDRNGENVEGFPVSLKYKASNPLLLVNYDGNKDYRYFIAGKNNKIYGYTKQGKLLPGWNPKSKVGSIKLPLQHFIVNNKDYLLAINEEGTLFLFNRKGEPRIDPVNLNSRFTNGFTVERDGSEIHFINSDVEGRIHRIDLAGDTGSISIKQWSGSQYFGAADVAGDVRLEYIYLDGDLLSVYDPDTSLIFTYRFQFPIDNPINFSEVPGEKTRISVISSTNSQIFMFNGEGMLFDNFPVVGTKSFEIVNFYNLNSFNIITSKENKLYIYQIQ